MTKRFLWIVSLLTFCFATTAWGGPKIFVEENTFNFGEIYGGEEVAHTFTFQNTGDAPLNVTKVRSSCGCTVAVPSEKIIPPGGTGELKATFDSERFRGEISKTIYLYTDDPIRGVVQFYIRGIVKEEVVLTPSVLSVGNIDPQSRWVGEVVVSNAGKTDIEITNVNTTIKEMTTEVASKRLSPGEATQIKITLDTPAGSRNINGYITLKIAGAQKDTFRIPVSALIRHNQR